MLERGMLVLATWIALVLVPSAAPAAPPWPPAKGPGFLFVHYGEEHWNDKNSDLTLPQVVRETVRYAPNLVTMSADKGQDGTVEDLSMWQRVMSPYDAAGIPYFAATGNHDRKNPEGDGVFPVDLTNYKNVFASRPYPFGDAAPYNDPNLSPRSRPASDLAGASSYYWVEYGNVRWIFLDNSCYSFRLCERVGGVNPPMPDAEGNQGQLEWLRKRAAEANRAGKLVFVVMHMATDDPRDLTHSSNVDKRHTMTAAPEEEDAFEQTAAEVGVDAVFVAHMKGQWQYRARGIPYYIDGGAGGELHTTGPVGVDHGYWHGYRLVRVDGNRVTTDTVPIFAANGVRVAGPGTARSGELLRFAATGKQPKHEHPVDLELRDPDPIPRSRGSAAGGAWLVRGLLALLALAVVGLLARSLRPPARRARALAGVIAGAAGCALLATVAFAQRSIPDDTPKDSLPNPARIWTSENPRVLAPVPSSSEDPRRDSVAQTQDGAFRARCPGTANVRITSGWAEAAHRVQVASRPGRMLQRVRLRRSRLAPGRRGTVAWLTFNQPSEVRVRIRRGRRVVRTLLDDCVDVSGRTIAVRWNGRYPRRGRLRAAPPGRYRVEVTVRADRPSFTWRRGFAVRR